MNYFDVIMIGVALSIDACALTIANCTTYSDALTKRKAWRMPVLFAIFQGAIPLIGFFIGELFAKYIQAFSGYVTSVVFFALCGKIIYDIVKEHRERKKGNKNDVAEKKSSKLTFAILLLQAVATSIDALVIGVTMSFDLTFSIYYAVAIIAGITLVLVTVALLIGKGLGTLFGKYANWVGAFILLALAVKSLIEAIIG